MARARGAEPERLLVERIDLGLAVTPHAYDVEDQVEASLTAPAGIPVSVQANFHATAEQAADEFTFTGTKAELTNGGSGEAVLLSVTFR